MIIKVFVLGLEMIFTSRRHECHEKQRTLSSYYSRLRILTSFQCPDTGKLLLCDLLLAVLVAAGTVATSVDVWGLSFPSSYTR